MTNSLLLRIAIYSGFTMIYPLNMMIFHGILMGFYGDQ
jgi:hypothetical protein